MVLTTGERREDAVGTRRGRLLNGWLDRTRLRQRLSGPVNLDGQLSGYMCPLDDRANVLWRDGIRRAELRAPKASPRPSAPWHSKLRTKHDSEAGVIRLHQVVAEKDPPITRYDGEHRSKAIVFVRRDVPDVLPSMHDDTTSVLSADSHGQSG